MSSPEDNQASKRETALLAWIQQTAPYGVFTLDTSFRVQSWNGWMETHSGIRSAEIIGKEIFTLFPDLRDRKLVSPFERALNGESSVLSTALHRYLLPFASPLRELEGHMRQTARITPLVLDRAVCGVVVVIEDVTQRENQAEALSRQHRRDEVLSWALAHLLKADEPKKTIRQLFFKIAEHLDFDTFFLYFRDMATGALGLYAAGGIAPGLEKDFAEYPLLATVADKREMVIFDDVQKHSEPEYAILKNAGIAAAVAIPLFANDHPIGLLCFATWSRKTIATDESDLLTTIAQYLATAVDRENTSLELQRAKEQLSNDAQLLEQKVQERTSRLQETISELETFSYTLAHDLKAPVLPPDASAIIEKLARTPKRMEALIHDLLHFSEVSRQEVLLGPVEVAPIIENVLALRVPAIRQAVTIVSPLHPVRAQKALLQQVLSNLIDNAAKFVSPQAKTKITIFSELMSGVTPSTRSRPLLFNSVEPTPPDAGTPPLENQASRVRIWVTDEGIGIPEEAHQKIFGIFERGVTAESYEGTGMGLAIVARAMQRMGGTCGVESELGKGSRFWIELPAV
jgi:PAS domain S-box-containing protein